MAHAAVQTDMTADDAKLQAALRRGGTGIKQFAEKSGAMLKNLAKSFMVVGAAATGAADIFVKLATVQADAEAKLEAVLKATGNAAGFTSSELKRMASELQSVTKFGDETTLSAMAVLATFKEIKGDQFKDAMVAAMDMATVLDGNVQGAIVQMGKALNDPIKGMAALADSGVSFTNQQKKQITTLQESGDVIGAQKVILAELAGEFGGAASAAVKTFSGRLAQMKNRLSDMGEKIGMALIPVLEKLEPLIKGIANFAENMNKKFVAAALVTAVLVGGLTAMTFVAMKVVGAIKAIITAIHAMTSAQIVAQAFSGPAGWATIAVGAGIAAAGVYGLSKMFTTLKDEAKAAVAEAKEVRGVGADGSAGAGGASTKGSASKSISSLTAAAAAEKDILQNLTRETAEREKHARLMKEEVNLASNKQDRTTAWQYYQDATASYKTYAGLREASEQRHLDLTQQIAAAEKKGSAARIKLGQDMLVSIEQQLGKVGKTEQQVAEITLARLVSENKIDAAIARQILAKGKELSIAKKAEQTAKATAKAEASAAKAKKATAEAAAKSLEERIKDLEKQGDQAYMSSTTKIIDDLQQQGASQEQIQRAQKARAILDTKASKEKAEAAAKAAKTKDKSDGDKGFSPAFEGLTSLYKRITTAKPEDRTAKASEESAKELKAMRKLMENPGKQPVQIAKIGL